MSDIERNIERDVQELEAAAKVAMSSWKGSRVQLSALDSVHRLLGRLVAIPDQLTSEQIQRVNGVMDRLVPCTDPNCPDHGGKASL